MKELYKNELKLIEGGKDIIKMVCDQGIYLVDLDSGDVFNILGQKVFTYAW